MSRHPQHDDVAAAVASWYRNGDEDQGYVVEERGFGWYRTNRDAPGWGALNARPTDDVRELLRDVDAYFGPRDVTIEFTQEPSIEDALIAAGWSNHDETVFLAHVGGFPATVDATIEPVTDIERFARVKLQAFGDTEEEPVGTTLSKEIASRRADLRGDGRGLVATADGEIAAMCAYYSGADYFVFLLGTRLPFRGRGIASAVLHHVVEEARASGARSVVINAREGGEPAALYRRLGFTDAVYRQWRFRKPS